MCASRRIFPASVSDWLSVMVMESDSQSTLLSIRLMLCSNGPGMWSPPEKVTPACGVPTQAALARLTGLAVVAAMGAPSMANTNTPPPMLVAVRSVEEVVAIP